MTGMNGCVVPVVAAVVLRVWLMHCTWLTDALKARPEVSTPANSMERVLECLELKSNGLSPYVGDTCHEMPLVLLLLRLAMNLFGTALPYLFLLVDIVTSYLLGKAAERYVKSLSLKLPKQCASEKIAADLLEKRCLPSIDDVNNVTRFVMASYLLNPMTIATGVAETSSILQNFTYSLILYFSMGDIPYLAPIFVAFAAYQQFYPILLIAPIMLLSSPRHWSSKSWQMSVISLSVCVAVWASLLYLSATVEGSWQFLESTYGFLFSVSDLTPNVGLFWYFFTEVFDHFRVFFLWVFQLNLLLYVIPLSVSLGGDDAFVLALVLQMLMSVFKPYPSVGDATVPMALIPAIAHLYRFIRHSLVVAGSLLVCVVMAPVMWYGWIVSGSANANFYFAITLVYCTAQIFLLTDILYAHWRLKLHMEHGLKPMLDGAEAKVILD